MSSIAVGDPIDVITGVQFDVALDLRIPWPLAFEWRRYYSTARVAHHLALGWGHTHAYDHQLRFDADGVTYVDPAGTPYHFPPPAADGTVATSGAGTLRRINRQTYVVKVAAFPACEFRFSDPAQPAQLSHESRGRVRHDLAFDARGLLVGIACGREPGIRIEHDATGRRVEALVWRIGADSAERRIWEGTYDVAGNLVRVVDAYRAVQTFAYDAEHRVVARTDRRGYGFVAAYDAAGRCSGSAGVDGMQEVRMHYRPEEAVTEVTRADGGTWRYAYADAGVTAITDPHGGTTTRTYAEDGRLVRETGPAGRVLREMLDDESGALVAPYTPAGACLPLGDPWFDQLRDLTVPRDCMGWDGYGEARCRHVIRDPTRGSAWLARLPRAVANALRVAEDADAARPEWGRVGPSPRGTDASRGGISPTVVPVVGPPPKKPMGVVGRPGLARHDPFGLLVSHTLPSGETGRWQYDANGNITRYVDYAGSEWQYDYASWNLLVRETDPLGHSVSFTYDPVERPTTVVDAGETTTRQEYDLADRLTTRWRHARARDRYQYAAEGGLIAAATDETARVRLAFGEHLRPVVVAPADGAERRCQYDARARLVAVTEAGGSALSFSYNIGAERTADLRDGRGVTRRFEGLRLGASEVLGRFPIQYAHDPAERRTVVVDPTGGRHTVQQLDLGVFLRRHYDGSEELVQYDWGGRCLAKVRAGTALGARPWTSVYGYSPVGALVSAKDASTGTQLYEYDAAHRLVGVMAGNGPRRAYAYDAAGNLTAAPGLEGVVLDQNRLVAANGRRFEYGSRDQVVREVGEGRNREYQYDAEDRLRTWRGDGREVRFRYDALGRRLQKETSEGVTEFVWDGERLAAEIAPDGALRVYVYADGAAMTPFLFVDYEGTDADPASGRRRYVYGNQVGCPVLVEDGNGHVLWRADVDAYGRTEVRPGARIAFHLRWPGHYFDAETGLHYNRHRYYSPELGRYLQVDPRDLAGGVNVYAYSSRPLDTVDVDGLAPCPKKPMVTPAEDDPEFQKAKDRADEVADDLRRALKDARENGEMHPLSEAGTTLSTMVVLRKDGTYEVVVTGNRSDLRLPVGVQEAMGDHRFVAHGDDRPPPIRQDDDAWRYGRDNPRTGDRENSTHGHAEQRGLRATDCDPETQGVAYVAPTRPCCEGCSTAIQTPHDQGGWGGGESNVSDLGKQSEWW